MKKRLLAMLLVLMLVVSLLPVGALAAGQIYQGNETFSYHITDSSLQAMVDKYNTSGSTSDVESVSITFDAPYLSGKSTFQFRNGYTIDFSNTSDAVQPDDISHLTIKLESSDSLTVPGDALDWTWVSSLPRRYDLSLDAGDGNCTVTFYVQNGDSFDNSSWIVYQTRTVPVGSTLGDNMPALPTQKDPDAHWIAWEIGGNNGDGRELHADTVITGDMSVYARKTLPSSGGEQIRVMGPENDFIEILKEKLNVETIEINGISAFGGGEETNPYYDPSRVTEEDPTENGWKNDGAYYRVMNTDQVPVPDDVPEHNDRVAPGELEGIKIYATVDGVNDTVITLNRSDLDVRVDQTVLRIYLREATEPDTPVEPDPAPETNPDVSDVRVVVDCETNDEHDKNVAIIGGSYTFNKAWDGDQWTCTVVIDPDDYVDTYNEIVPGHALNPENQTGTLLYIYDGSEWVYNGDVTPTVTFTVACSGTDPEPEEPRDPTEDELNQLYVDLECINADAQHAEKRFHLDQDNSYVTVDFTTGICTVEPRYDFILQRYNEKVSDGHTYADDAERTLLLSWNPETKAWDVAGAPSITRQVKCETPEQPDVYKIYVTVHNGTATFRGSEVTSYILAAENENITITFTPDEGYTLDYATIDGNMLLIPDGGVYTLKQVDKDHTIEVVYAEDKLGGGDDGESPDGTPDYRQVFVKYVAADGNGFVTPSFDTFNLEVDENGKVMTNVALSLSGVATPNTDATFAYWTIEGLGYDGGAYSYEADLSGEDFIGYVADETYTFTAYFNGPVVKPEQPNVYKINVTVHNGTATFRGSEVTSYILAAENENITITFTPDEGYTLDYATIDGNMLLIPDGGVYTLKWVDSNHTIEVFYESDKIGTEDPNEGDGVPDKYQATVNFVAGENGKVTGNVTKVYTIFGADGKYAEEGVITPCLNGVTVTPDEGYKVDGWTNAAGERVNPESEITVEGGDVVVFTVNFQSDPSLKEITSFEKKLVTDRKTYHSFGLRVPTFIRNGSTVVVDEGKGVTLLYAISLTGTPGAEYAITDTGADVADGYALTGVIPETGVVTVYVTKDFTWREAAAAAYKDDALVNTAAVELTDNPNEPGQESTEEVDVVIDWDDPNVPVVPSDPDDEDEDDEVFVPNWLNTEDHYSYIVGYEDGEVKPNNNITRAEVATIFFRLLTDDARARYWSQTNDYSDIAPESWYNNAVSTLSNMGIINGYEDGTFKPNAPITRAEFTAIATRFFDYTAEYEGAFNDVSRSAWYADCVQAAVDMGLVDGYPDGGFHPNSNITRAEAVTIVNRVLNRAPHEDHLLDEDEMNVWPDNVYGAWYYADMQEATNSHDYDWIRVSGERVEEWTEKLPERDWAALEQEWSSAYSG